MKKKINIFVKIGAVLVVIFVLVLLNGLVHNVRLIDRGVAIGIGVDLKEDEYNVITQVVLPKNGGVSTGGNDYVNYQESGKTISEALSKITAKSGTELSIGQTIVVVLGRELVEKGNLTFIKDFMSENSISDNVLVAMAEDKAEDIIKANVPIGGSSCFQLSRVLAPVKVPLGIASTNIKNLVTSMYGDEALQILPIASKKPNEPSSDQAKNKVENAEIIDVSGISLVNDSGIVGKLEDKMANAYTLLRYQLQDGNIQIVDQGKTMSVQLMKSKARESYDWQNKTYKVNVSLTIVSKDYRVGEDGMTHNELNDAEQDILKQDITESVQSLIDYGNSIGVDVLDIKQGFYRHYPDHKQEIAEEDFLQNVKLEMTYDIIQV